MSESPHPPFGIRLRAFAVVWVLLFGNLATVVHAVTVRHVTCPEHGELVHLAVAPSDAEAQIGPTDGRGSLQEGPVTGAPRAHHHCGICALGRDRVARTVQAPRAVVAAPLAAPPPTPPVDAPRAQLAVYQFAPKTSPPPSSRELLPSDASRRDGGERFPHTLG